MIRRALLVCAIALGLPCPAQAQNLLVNGEFDADLSGWSIAPGTTLPVWDDVDIDDWTGSGAVRLTNDSPEAFARIFPLEQCVRPTRPGQYRVIAHGYIPSGQNGVKLVVNYALALNADDCTMSQGVQASGGEFITTLDGWGRYERLIGTQVPSPVPPNAMLRVRLGIEKDAAGGSFHGFFDAVAIVRDTLIFRSGFE